MVAYKAAQTARFLKSPDAGCDAALLYGPDAGLVADRARTLAALWAGAGDPPGEIVRLEDRDLADDPDRLAVETQTIPMFGGRQVVHARAGGRIDAARIEPLLAEPLEAYLLVEAGNLRPTAKLRKVFEASERCAALPCYADPARDLGPLIDEVLTGQGLSIAADVKSYLMARLGADHAASRAEVEKLALYAEGRGGVGMADVDAIVGDAAAVAQDALINATAQGDTGTALSQLDRLLASGTGAQSLLILLARHFERLHRICAEVEAGAALKTALGRMRPPLHFKQRDAFAAQCQRWSERRAAQALDRIQQTVRASRLRPELERQQTERLVLALSRGS